MTDPSVPPCDDSHAPTIEEQEDSLAEELDRQREAERFDEGFAEYERRFYD